MSSDWWQIIGVSKEIEIVNASPDLNACAAIVLTRMSKPSVQIGAPHRVIMVPQGMMDFNWISVMQPLGKRRVLMMLSISNSYHLTPSGSR